MFFIVGGVAEVVASAEFVSLMIFITVEMHEGSEIGEYKRIELKLCCLSGVTTALFLEAFVQFQSHMGLS